MKSSQSLVPIPEPQGGLPAKHDHGGARWPASLVPSMWAHLLLTGDRKAHREWRRRVEAILQADAVDDAVDDDVRAALADRAVWRRIQRAGRLGNGMGLALAAGWLAVLIPAYAATFGAAALAYLLPLPLSWRFGRTLWQSAALKGELVARREAQERKPPSRFSRWLGGVGRSFSAGFGFGFSLVFLQGLVSWFLTPAPTFGLELAIDLAVGVQGGLITGTAATLLAPAVMGRGQNVSPFNAIAEPASGSSRDVPALSGRTE